jgi:hypothetical protein
MNKDDYAKMKIRESIANSFIEKLKEVKTEDIELIPALEDYIISGNRELFGEYLKFHAIKDNIEKHERLVEAMERVKDTESKYKQSMMYYERIKREYVDWIQEFNKTFDNDYPNITSIHLDELYKFLAKTLASGRKRRLLFVRMGDKLYSADCLTLVDEKKAVIELRDGEHTFLPPKKTERMAFISNRKGFELIDF